MNDMIAYFKTMITPPVDDALVLVAKPSEIAYDEYLEEVLEEGQHAPIKMPMVHGVILLEEPTDEESKHLLSILKPGGHIVLIPVDPIGYKGVIALEDTGFEVRDAIFVADTPETFYYTSKASKSEREDGLIAEDGERANKHPTVKPIKIMEWCARDIKPESKIVDPFLGSGTTGISMSRLGHDFVGIEINPEYAKICESRIRHWMPLDAEMISENEDVPVKMESDRDSIFDLLKDGFK